MLVIIILIIIVALCIFMAVNLLKKQKKAKNEIEEKIKAEGFIISKKIQTSNSRLYVDDVNKKWFVQDNRYNSNPKFMKFSDLLEFEIYEDGNSIAKGKTGRALVGGVLFGVVGAVAGSAGKKEIKNTCSALQVRIRVNDLQCPEITMPIIMSETKKDTPYYRLSLEQAKQIAATLAYIQNGKKDIDK